MTSRQPLRALPFAKVFVPMVVLSAAISATGWYQSIGLQELGAGWTLGFICGLWVEQLGLWVQGDGFSQPVDTPSWMYACVAALSLMASIMLLQTTLQRLVGWEAIAAGWLVGLVISSGVDRAAEALAALDGSVPTEEVKG